MHCKIPGVVLALLLSSHVSAKEHLIEVSRSDLHALERSVLVPKGKFKEVCVALKSGDAFAWSFVASAPTDFNVHYHQGKETFYPAKSAGTREGSGVLRAERDEHYCWMWKAALEDATVDIRVKDVTN